MLTDGGIETVLIFHESRAPAFAAFGLLKDEDWHRARCAATTSPTSRSPREHGLASWLESPRGGRARAGRAELGYSRGRARHVQPAAIALMEELREGRRRRTDRDQRLHRPARRRLQPGGAALRATAARDYHAAQIVTFAGTAANLVTAITMTYAEEAIGIARAAAARGSRS